MSKCVFYSSATKVAAFIIILIHWFWGHDQGWYEKRVQVLSDASEEEKTKSDNRMRLKGCFMFFFFLGLVLYICIFLMFIDRCLFLPTNVDIMI